MRSSGNSASASVRTTLHPLETLAALYLIAPLFVFFFSFVRIEIATPACLLIAVQLFQIARQTEWRRSVDLFTIESLCLLLFAAISLCWLYGVGPLRQNADWTKHYAVLNFLIQNPWPASTELDKLGPVTLRYYLGWYLIPALASKVMGGHGQQAVLLIWSVAGTFLFFRLVADLVGRPLTILGILAIPTAILLFGGADLIGLISTAYQRMRWERLEWWAGWIQYPSTITAIAWAPQHTLPAWLGIALLMRQYRDGALLPFCALLLSAIALWSPFAAIGLLPFVGIACARSGALRLALDWRTGTSVLLLGLPVGLYLISGQDSIPKGFIGSIPCTFGRPCFSWILYAWFLLIEVGLAVLILYLRKVREEGFLLIATLTLCLIPLYKIGLLNDFAMRASTPALAVLSILCAKYLLAGPRRYSFAILAMLALALPQVYVNLTLPLNGPVDVPPDMTFEAPGSETIPRSQYFAPAPIWVLR